MSTIKIKTQGGEYLEEINQIPLNQNFSGNLNDAIDKINENFKRLISLPFLQGDAGNSVFEQEIIINTDTVLGKNLRSAISKAVYDTEEPTDGDNINTNGGIVDGHCSWGLDETPVIFYRHKETTEQGEKFYYASQQFVVLIDKRIEFLRNLNESLLTNFKDMSRAMTITGVADINQETGQPDEDTLVFTVKTYNILPTLYYDADRKYWCWNINDTKTGVIAQGVKGDRGDDAQVYICLGQKRSTEDQTENSYLKIIKVFQPVAANTEAECYNLIPDGALLCVWFKDDRNPGSGGSILDNCTFGIAKTSEAGGATGDYKYIDISSEGSGSGKISLDLMTIFNDLDLHSMLTDITNIELYDTAVRGLFVPNKYKDSDYSHMAWSEIDANQIDEASYQPESIAIGLVDKDKTQMKSTDTDLFDPKPYEDKGLLNIYYPVIKSYKGSYRKLLPYTDSGIVSSPVKIFAARTLANAGESMYSTASRNKTDGLESVIKLENNNEDCISVISNNGIFIQGKEPEAGDFYPRPDVSRFPEVYTEKTNIYNKYNNITLEDSNIYICNTLEYSGSYQDPMHQFNEDNITKDDLDQYRWALQNIGIKMVSSDVINRGGTIIISSDNRYKAVIINKNKVMFDYKVRAELNDSNVNDQRPRYKDYIGVQIGGYNTIYNFVTSNSKYPLKPEDNGKEAASILTNHREPIELSTDQNKEFTFLSGKSGYTTMIENHGDNNVFNVDPTCEYIENSSSLEPINSTREWGLITTYDCLWTKVGNVVDVKGKIFITKAQYDNNQLLGLTVYKNTARPITYAELFRFLKKNGTYWAFPLPIVIKKDENKHYASTGCVFDNPDDKQYSTSVTEYGGNTVNKNEIKAADYPGQYPTMWYDTQKIYHNDIYNGSAQFHFYGTNTEEVFYGGDNYVDKYGTKPNSKVIKEIEMLNNVFTVTADIGKSIHYNDRFWCLRSIPNYDAINHIGTADQTYDNLSYLQKQLKFNDGSFGPLRVVNAYEETSRTESIGDLESVYAPTISSKYGVNDRLVGNQKISVNIGSYAIRYITFAFSYLLDDDIQQEYNEDYMPTPNIDGSDEDVWNIPSSLKYNTLEEIAFYGTAQDNPTDPGISVNPGAGDITDTDF